MPDLAAGTTVLAADWPDSVFAQDSTQFTNLTNTTYTPGSPACAVTFVAPTSGRVLLTVGGRIRGPDRVFISPQVFEGPDATGQQIITANVILRGVCSYEAGQPHAWSRMTLLDGLIPGAIYYARTAHRADLGSGAADIFVREIGVRPVS